jgi:membrane-bound lytic murein transglycosylase F
VLVSAARAAAPIRGETDERYDELFKKYGKRYFGPGFDWRLFKAQAMAESNLSPSARSRCGARGIMQLMPTTFGEIRSRNPELQSIDDPEFNIAAGICYDRVLWRLWTEHPTDKDRLSFMLGSYNAGRRPLLRAQGTARERNLDHRIWSSITEVAAAVRGWRYQETLAYVQRIDAILGTLTGTTETKKPPAPD